MGSPPRLPAKDQYRYRKGSTSENLNCRYCRHFTPDYPVGKGEKEPRCRMLGLHAGRRYRIREDHTCDAQVMSDAYKAEIANWMGRRAPREA